MAPVFRHRVRYHEADAQGFMFNSRFLELADVGMTEYFRHLGLPYLDLVAGGMDPSVVRAVLDFKRPARFEDQLDVRVDCVRVGTSSFELHTEVLLEGELVADLALTYVNVDATQAVARPLPDEVAARLRGDASSGAPAS
ncbi:acyl-CoA thioesterase [Nocardioides astragali]|uniref:Acyl-CoA thioesterase n=1 Tax=Nocardioides astragali TaxID=1776736 RepID=A0ABW2MZL9_9ACTN|nr:thioesterase family protein [Nocardioides astragali]